MGRIAAASVVALIVAACEDQKSSGTAPAPSPPVTVAKPIVKELVEIDEFVGRFEATESVEIRARVGGYLEKVAFRDGAIVMQGDLLFVIDPRPFQAALAQAEAAVNSGRTRVEFGRVEHERAETLVRQGTAAQRTLDERRQAFHEAQADLAGARAAVDQARLELGFTEIRSPIAGRVSRKLVSEGNLVAANDTLLTTVVTLDPIHFYFDIDERSYLAYSRMAQNGSRALGPEESFDVTVSLADEKEPKHRGRLDFVDNRMDGLSGTMRGRAIVENPNHLIVPGLFGRINIPGSNRYAAVLVPDEAISADLDRRFVSVVAPDGSVSQKTVRPGPRQDGYRIVRQGLTGDETIIVSGLQRAQFAGRVTPNLVELPPSR